MSLKIGDAFAPATVEPPTVLNNAAVVTTTFHEITMPDGSVLVDIIVCGERHGCVTGMKAVRIRNELRQIRAAIAPQKQGEANG